MGPGSSFGGPGGITRGGKGAWGALGEGPGGPGRGPGEVLGGSSGNPGGVPRVFGHLGRNPGKSTKTYKNLRKINDFWGPGDVLGASWGLLGVSWGVLGASWGGLGASWGVFGASWGLPGSPGRLGCLLENFGGRRGE